MEGNLNREITELTAAELSHVWSAYMENSMMTRIFEYFREVTEDEAIRKVVGDILTNSEKNLEDLKKFFEKENIQVPHGFDNDDVRTGAPKLYSDVFVLYFCDDIVKLKMYVYPSALGDAARADVREFFSKNIDIFKSVQNDLVNLMLSKGVYIRPPQVVVEKQVDFVEKKSYLKGLFGNSRPLNVAEITSINKLLQRAAFAKAVLLSYAQTASEEDVSQYFLKGKTLAQSIVEDVRSILEKEDVPAPANWDFKVYESRVPPFSDRLMLFFLLTCLGVLCFHNASQGVTASLRADVSTKFISLGTSMVAYFERGIKLMMEKGYFERPLQIIDMEKIRKTPKE